MTVTKGSGSRARAVSKLAIATLLISAATIVDAHAGTDTTFNSIVTMITNWTQGSLGKVLALSMFLIGVGMSVMRQSIAPVGVALAAALALFYGPTIISGVLTGTAPHHSVIASTSHITAMH